MTTHHVTWTSETLPIAGSGLHVARADGTGEYPIMKSEAGWGAMYAYWRPKP